MKHSIPLRFIAVILTICLCSFCMYRPLSAKSNPSSAQNFPVGSTKRFTLAPYDTDYFYFQIPTLYQGEKHMLCIALSGNTAGLQLSATDGCGQPLSLKKRNGVFELSDTLPAGERCFLCIHNTLSDGATGSLTVSCMPQETKSPKPKNTPLQKTPHPTKRKSAGRKTAPPNKRKPTARKTTPPNKQLPTGKKSYGSHSSQSHIYQNRTPVPISNQESVTRKSAKKKSSKCRPSPAVPAATPPTQKTHFIRLRQGTSLFLAEPLFDTIPTETLYIMPSSDSISVDNGIIYVQKDGLFYLTIAYGSRCTTCTVLVTAT